MSEQGAVFGTLSSAQTLARMISYSASNVLLGRVSTAAPYWGAFGIDLLALAAAGHFATECRPVCRLARDAIRPRPTCLRPRPAALRSDGRPAIGDQGRSRSR